VIRTFHKPQRYILLALILLLALFLNSNKTSSILAQETREEQNLTVEKIFNALTPKERVGQLFVVSFNGSDVSPDSDIAELIQIYRIGGVVLSAENENFTNDQDTPAQVLTLTNALQTLVKETPPSVSEGEEITPISTVTSPITTPVTTTPPTATITPVITATPVLTTTPVATTTVETYTPLPLFIATSHEGGGFPYTQILNDLTDVPNQMALGATWDSENARLVGEVVGQELSLLGINMLFGPSLDVLDNPRPERGGSLGTRTFGGHPFWVGKMGQAYIRGVHQGSDHQVLTIAKHFPGFGSSDREINQGVPTILKSLDDLRQIELVPFFKVTQLNPDNPDETESLTDGLMTAHVRYQGLRGNVSISLDARNLPTILALKEFVPWREADGLIVSAPLGVPAALEGVAATGGNFPARRLAQDAFLAGSDVLLLTDFAFADKPDDELVNIKNAIGFFQEKYISDPNFQTAVDKAVRRIIKAKIKIYGKDLLEAETQKPEENLALLDEIAIDLDQIAQAGVTLITPMTQAGADPLPDAPQPGDNILIFTDDRLAQDCSTCPEFSLIETTALQEIILQLFGPQATGQILPEQITSLGFTDLKAMLSEAPPPESAGTEALIKTADWIIFAMLDINTEKNPQSDAVRILLRNRYDTLRNKKLVLFAFDAPYFLDDTEISQLTAYYGLYSRGRDYLKTAARLLFQQFEPTGASPVRIPALGPLDLSPDPNQVIQLQPVHKIDKEGKIIPFEEAEVVTALDLGVGEGILFRTSIIVDRNGHPVPDGTSVDFFRYYPLEGLSLEPLKTSTINGIAEITIIKDRDTPLQVSVSSDLATGMTFDIGPGIVDTPTPTATSTPTETPTPTDTPTDTPTIENTPTLTPTPLPTPPTSPPPPSPITLADLIYALVGMVLVGAIAFTLGGDRFSLEERVRPALVAIAIGLVGYIGYAILAIVNPQAGIIDRGATGHWVAPLISLVFAILGVVAWFFKPGRIFWVQDVERLKTLLKRSRLATYFTDGELLTRLKRVLNRNAGRESQDDGQNQESGNKRQ
jgi:beta-N-acetylhexosaminidase